MSVSLGPRAVLRGPLGSTGAAHQARGSAPSALRQRWAAPPSAKRSPSCRALDRGPSTVLPSHRGLFSPRDGAPAPKVKQAPPASFSPGSETPPFSSASRRLLNRPLADCSPFPPSRVSSAGQRSPAAPHGLLTNLQRLGRFGAVLAPSARLVSRPPNPRSDHAHSRLLRLVQPAPPPDYNRHNALRPARDWLSPAAAPNGTLRCWQVAPSGRAGAPEPPPAMGSAESSEGRRASFGMDEEERVRVLQGIRVSGRPEGGRGGAGRSSAARGTRPRSAPAGSAAARWEEERTPGRGLLSGPGFYALAARGRHACTRTTSRLPLPQLPVPVSPFPSPAPVHWPQGLLAPWVAGLLGTRPPHGLCRLVRSCGSSDVTSVSFPDHSV